MRVDCARLALRMGKHRAAKPTSTVDRLLRVAIGTSLLPSCLCHFLLHPHHEARNDTQANHPQESHLAARVGIVTASGLCL